MKAKPQLVALLVGLSGLAAAYPLVKRQTAGSPKLVVAHHIVGNTAGFTLDNWTQDVTLASSKGIDGFALNIAADDFTFQQVGFAYQAAAAANPNFKVFLSLDMDALNNQINCNTTDAGAFVRNVTSTFLTQPAQLQIDGKAFVSTFAGESCTLGGADVFTGWNTEFTQHPDLAGKIHFVPSFFIDIQQFKNFKGVMDGDFNFNGGWPIDLTTKAAPQILGGTPDFNNLSPNQQAIIASQIGSFDLDDEHITQLGLVADSAHTYMTAVAPWFFTHFDQAHGNKNFIFDADDHLYVTRWQNVIQNRDKVDFVELVTWNDFGESHYLGPIEGNLPPGSEVWTNGFDHQGFLEITNHFATWYKTGAEPPITTDQLVMWARPHPKNAKASSDPLPPPTNFELTQDQLWAVVLATAPASLTLATGDNATQTFDVQPGVNKFNMSLTPGGFMQGTLTRNNVAVIDLKPDGYTFDPNPATFNFNVFVAAASGNAAAAPAPPASASSDPAAPPATSAATPASTDSASTSAAAAPTATSTDAAAVSDSADPPATSTVL
ncbi:Glycoside Hydrolase Family 71 protein [Trametes cinnabarina]|uniref:Glycoside Hydrolase Family 71 protein n=1 Tax=Pycnoporus cinnabarinus TaxID=5643 RepID=A0A060SGA3_PYCCI|nr:Glycoside Hydrolase Family 71 protein [Trametes cinnabarina]